MKRFLIRWADPETGEVKQREMDFEDEPVMSALDQAEDCGYAWADKGPFTVSEITK